MSRPRQSLRLSSFLTRPAWSSWWGVLFFAVVGLGWVFGDVTSFRPLLYDDPEYLGGRPEGFGFAYWKELWTSAVVNLWHPLTVFSHDLLSRIGGGALWRHHLFNVLLHLGVALAVAYWLRGLAWTLGGASAVAFLWLLHPCLVESVAWISGRKDVLSGLLVILTLGLAARGRAWWLVLICGIGALLAKPVAIVLPVVLMIQDLAIRDKSLWDRGEWKGLFRRHAALGFAAVLVILLTLNFQGQGGQAVADPRGVMERLTGAGWGIWRALSLWFWPRKLHTAYDDPEMLPIGLGLFAFAVLGFAGWGAASARLGLVWRVSLALFVCFLLPTLGFVRAGNHIVADRYLYLPGLGLTMLVVAGLLKANRWGFLICACLAVILGMLTKSQRKHWVTTRALFERVLAVEPKHSYALAKVGTLERIDGRLESARKYYEASLVQDAGSPDAHKNLAEMALEKEEFQSAYEHYVALAKTWRREVWLHERLAKLAFNLGKQKRALEHLDDGVKLISDPADLARFQKLRTEMQGR